LVVLDEPLSALDVPAQADLLAMLVGLQTSRRLTTLLITHHLEAARVLAHSVAVMCAGRVVETGPPSEVLAQPRHAYTQRLVASVPRLEPLRRTTAAPFHKPG
jgi:ABC-type dipeptide/oligopeptide/nickel transport system ATPase component